MSDNSGITKLLDAERKANEIIEGAQKAKQEELRRADTEQKANIAKFRTDEDAKFNQMITQKYGNVNEAANLEAQNDIDIKNIKLQFEHGRSKVVDLLLRNVVEVDLEVPEVVKGEYEKLA